MVLENIKIKLDSIDKVKRFVNIVNQYNGEVDLSSGRNTINGKSIIGICSLDLRNELMLNIDSNEDLSALINELKPYIVGDHSDASEAEYIT